LKKSGEDIDDPTIQEYRMAALLHDIGHFPFSHTGEHAAESYAMSQEDTPPEHFTFRHEDIGVDIIRHNPQIQGLLSDENIDVDRIVRLIGGAAVPEAGPEDKYRNIVNSDFDADRLDYLLRVAHYSGLPYGVVDLDYLIEQIEIHPKGMVYLREKALGAADHFLLSRFFQYRQIIHNKTSKAFEWLLEDLIIALVKKGKIDLKKNTIDKMIRCKGNGNKVFWEGFNDHHVMQLIKQFHAKEKDEDLKFKAEAIINRIEPILIVRYERIAQHDGEDYSDKARLLRVLCDEIVTKKGIPMERCKIDNISPLKITSIPRSRPWSHFHPHKDNAEEKALYIKIDGKESPTPINLIKQSLTKQLSDNIHASLRLYVLLKKEESDLEDEIRKEILEKLPQA